VPTFINLILYFLTSTMCFILLCQDIHEGQPRKYPSLSVLIPFYKVENINAALPATLITNVLYFSWRDVTHSVCGCSVFNWRHSPINPSSHKRQGILK
jgi:hypothetical protein